MRPVLLFLALFVGAALSELAEVSNIVDVRNGGALDTAPWKSHEDNDVLFVGVSDGLDAEKVIHQIKGTADQVYTNAKSGPLLVAVQDEGFFLLDVTQAAPASGHIFATPSATGTPVSWAGTNLDHIEYRTDIAQYGDSLTYVFGSDADNEKGYLLKMDGTKVEICSSKCFDGESHTFDPHVMNGRVGWCWISPESETTLECPTVNLDGTGQTSATTTNFGRWVAFTDGLVLVTVPGDETTYAMYRLDTGGDGSLTLINQARFPVTEANPMTISTASGIKVWGTSHVWDVETNTVTAYGNTGVEFGVGELDGWVGASDLEHGKLWKWNADTSTFDAFPSPSVYPDLRGCQFPTIPLPLWWRESSVLACTYGSGNDAAVVSCSSQKCVGLVDKNNAALGATEFTVERIKGMFVMGERVYINVDNGVLLAVESSTLKVTGAAPALGLSVLAVLVPAVLAFVLL